MYSSFVLISNSLTRLLLQVLGPYWLLYRQRVCLRIPIILVIVILFPRVSRSICFGSSFSSNSLGAVGASRHGGCSERRSLVVASGSTSAGRGEPTCAGRSLSSRGGLLDAVSLSVAHRWRRLRRPTTWRARRRRWPPPGRPTARRRPRSHRTSRKSSTRRRTSANTTHRRCFVFVCVCRFVWFF